MDYHALLQIQYHEAAAVLLDLCPVPETREKRRSKKVMAGLVRKLYSLGIIDGSFIGLNSTPVMANTKQNNPVFFRKDKFSGIRHLAVDPNCKLSFHVASNQYNEKNFAEKGYDVKAVYIGVVFSGSTCFAVALSNILRWFNLSLVHLFFGY